MLAYGMSGKVFHGPFLQNHPGFRLLAVTERSVKKAEKDYPGITSYSTVEELLNDVAIELIVINTPNNTHFEYAEKALHAGKHILVEKPFTPTVAEATSLFKLAAEKNLQIFVYQNRRWDSDFTTVKEVINSGKLGKLSEVHIRYDRYKPAIGIKAFKEEPFPASGLLYDLGPHVLDQAISLFGIPISFHKILGKNRKDTQVDDYFCIHLTYPESLNVFVYSNMLVVDIQPSFIVHGTNGTLVKERADIQEEQLLKGIKPGDPGFGMEAKGKEAKLTTLNTKGLRSTQLIKPKPSTYASVFDAVYQSLVYQHPFPVTQEQQLAQLEILAAHMDSHIK